MYRPTVYTASQLYLASMWRNCRVSYPEIEFTARWIDYATPESEAATPLAELAYHWTLDIQDVQRSDFTLIYKDVYQTIPDLPLRGALVEAGAALGAGKMVLAVSIPQEHSWTWHPRVVRLANLPETFDFLKRWFVIPPKGHTS